MATGVFLATFFAVTLAVGWLVARSNFSGKLLGKWPLVGGSARLSLEPDTRIIQVHVYGSFDAVPGDKRVSEFQLQCSCGDAVLWKRDFRFDDTGRPGMQHEIVPVHEFRIADAGEYAFAVQHGALQQIRFEELELQVRAGKPRARRWIYVVVLGLSAGVLALLLMLQRK